MEFRLKNKRFIKRKIKSWNGNIENDLDNIKVTLLNYTPYNHLCKYIPELVTATWNENIQEFRDTLLPKDRDEIMKLCFEGKLIPTALKSIPVTVLIEGITTHDVTHLLRHSGLSFAADCTGDKYIVDRPIIMPSFLNDCPEEYVMRYLDIQAKSYELYDDICNNLGTKVHIQDARLVLPRTMETFYYVTGSLFDFIKFLNQRIDMQVQPKSDNVLALKLYKELKKVYPLNINVDARNNFYCSESEHELSSKWYSPLPQNETEYTKNMETVYGDMKEMYGYSTYQDIKNKILTEE
jgi:thymidylate synthase (FAD)